MRFRSRWTVFCLFAATLAGCHRELAVGTTFPIPVMERVPVEVALYLDSALREHAHREDLPGGGSWSVALGPANTALFEQLLRGMFRSVVSVREPRASGKAVAVFQPVIQDYQFSTPEQSKTAYYEAWLQYRLRVYTPNGSLALDWPFTGYGRSESQLLAAADSLDEATQRAMRDAASVVVLELTRQPAVLALVEPPGSKEGGAHER